MTGGCPRWRNKAPRNQPSATTAVSVNRTWIRAPWAWSDRVSCAAEAVGSGAVRFIPQASIRMKPITTPASRAT